MKIRDISEFMPMDGELKRSRSSRSEDGDTEVKRASSDTFAPVNLDEIMMKHEGKARG